MFIRTHRKQVWILLYRFSLPHSDLLKPLIIGNYYVRNTLDIFESEMWVGVVDALIMNYLYNLIDISCDLDILSEQNFNILKCLLSLFPLLLLNISTTNRARIYKDVYVEQLVDDLLEMDVYQIVLILFIEPI